MLGPSPKVFTRVALAVGILGAAQPALADSWFHFDPFTLEAEIRFDGRFDNQEQASGLLFDGHTISPEIVDFPILQFMNFCLLVTHF